MNFSPNKPKNGGITAGIARAGTGKDSATGNGVDDSEEVRQLDSSQILFLVLLVHPITAALRLSIIWSGRTFCCSFSSGVSLLPVSVIATVMIIRDSVDT